MESLDPLPEKDRSWDTRAYILMWIGCSFQPSPFIFGASLLVLGIPWYSVCIATLVGNAILLWPLIKNGQAGVKYGVPFPVLLRASFGYIGAKYAALMRGLVAIGWVSVNLWFGAVGLASGAVTLYGRNSNPTDGAKAGWFAFFVACHIGCILLGLDRVKKVLVIAAPLQAAGLLAIVIWAFTVATPAEILVAAKSFEPNHGGFSPAAGMLVAVTATCAGWSTLTLNIADLSRYANSEKSFVRGQVGSS